MRRSSRTRYLLVSVVAGAGLALGIGSLAIARHDPGGSFGGNSVLDGIFELTAAWSLVLAGLLFSVRRPRNRFGLLLTAGGFAWFLPEWSNPGVGSALVFTVGQIGFLACAPLIGHAALAYPSGRLASLAERAVVGFAYAGGVVLLGVLPTSVFDPQAEGCLQCPTNLALVHGDSGAVGAFERWGLRLGLVWATALTVALLWRLARATKATMTVVAPVLLTAGGYLALVGWDIEHSLGRNVLSNDSFDVRLWRYEAVALTVLGAGVVWGLVRGRRARAAVAALVVELGRAPGAGDVRDALAGALADPTLQLAYRRSDEEGYIDEQGRPIELADAAGRAITPLLRDGRPVAALVHDARLHDDPGLVEEVVAAARVAVENERFQAEIRAQLESLRASRARIVATGDAERRRLERDLHDGAQQRLVGCALVLRMLRTQAEADGDGSVAARLDEADTELRNALAELRELAHGIYPVALAEEGLAAAFDTLAEEAPAAIELDALPRERFDVAVENAAYFVVAETLKRTHALRARVGASRADGRLVVELEADAVPDEELTDLEDRVGALGGRLVVDADDGHLRLRAELPCA